MASTIPRCLTRRSATSGSWIQLNSNQSRWQSTRLPTVPPELPRYVDIPQPLQPQSANLPPMKGILPTPRQIFEKGGMEKDSPEYFDRVNPTRTKERPIPFPQHKEAVDYKTRITALRRRHLREGIHQLRQRKTRTDNYLKAQSQQRAKELEEAIRKPRRREDVFTQVSVQDVVKQGSTVQISAEQIAEQRERLAVLEAAKAEERRVNLHTLYMNARDFIVTEEQLNKKVEEVFDAPFYQNQKDPSIWREYGTPERITDLLNKSQGRSNRAVDGYEGYVHLTRARLQKIAEELTGGKMEDANRKVGNRG